MNHPLITVVIAGLWFILIIFLVNSPARRLLYREKLARKGKLLAPDDPAGRMVLIPAVRGYWEQYPSRRPHISRALNTFTSMMMGYRREFLSKEWYLDDGDERRTAWINLTSTRIQPKGPIEELGIACNCKDELLKHVDVIVTAQLELRRHDLRYAAKKIVDSLAAVNGEIDRLKGRASELEDKLSVNQAKQQYEPDKLFQYN